MHYISVTGVNVFSTSSKDDAATAYRDAWRRHDGDMIVWIKVTDGIPTVIAATCNYEADND